MDIKLIDGPCGVERNDRDDLVVRADGCDYMFDSIYPALGSDVNNMLANMLGVKCGDAGCIEVDRHQRTSLSGLYAAGDVVTGLDQISHAMGEGGVAAVAIRNDLAKAQPLIR